MEVLVVFLKEFIVFEKLIAVVTAKGSTKIMCDLLSPHWKL